LLSFVALSSEVLQLRLNVVIATHRRAELLERTLESLTDTRKPDGFKRVIIVENGEADGSRQVCERFSAVLPLNYRHLPTPGKGRSLQWALEHLGHGFALFLDDDVRVCEDLLERYAQSAERYGKGHFFGGPLKVDYEVEPLDWLRSYVPKSATGWTPRDPAMPLHGQERFLGANFGAFVEDLLDVGGFSSRIGPGALRAGTEGNPAGSERELQDRMLVRGHTPIYVEGAVVWHFVPRERCTVGWALHRMFRNEFYGVVSLAAHRPVHGPRLFRVPAKLWLSYAKAAVLALLARASPDPERRFRRIARLNELRGRIHGHRSARIG
jgi:hypothetical protein